MAKVNVIHYVVWYDDGTKYNNTKFEELPRDGVIGLVLFENTLKPDGNHTKCVYKGYDYYFRSEGPQGFIYGCDLDSRERSSIKDINNRYLNPIILRGKWTDRQTLQDIIEEINLCQLPYNKQIQP